MYKVLVVEDEEVVRRGIVMTTDWADLDCMVAGEGADGLSGLETARRVRPDLIICDIRMPKLDGLSMAKKLREEGSQAKIIFLTAYSDFAYAREAIRLGASDYLLKPFQEGELEETVRKILGRESERRDQVKKEHLQEVLPDRFLEMRFSGKNTLALRAASYIQENFKDPDLSVRKIAEELGVSESHLSHVFRKETDYTINSFITRVRIRKAMELLREGQYRIYEVAEKTGYRDITYFSSTFKKITGMSPSDY